MKPQLALCLENVVNDERKVLIIKGLPVGNAALVGSLGVEKLDEKPVADFKIDYPLAVGVAALLGGKTVGIFQRKFSLKAQNVGIKPLRPFEVSAFEREMS